MTNKIYGKELRFFPLFLAFLLSFDIAFAQRHELGMGFGTHLYKGDITESYKLSNFRPAGEVFYRLNFSPAVAMRVNIATGRLGASGADSKNKYITKFQPNSFSTQLLDIAVMGEYNFLNYRAPKERMRWSPYLFGGVAVFYFNPKSAEPLGNVSPIQPAIPIGVGVKYKASRKWNLGFEFGARKTFTDYLDNVSDKDIGTNLQRGFKDTKDWYTFIGLSASYTIYTIKCPNFEGYK
jgi:hypothetical protein